MAFTLKARIGRGRTTETFTARLSVGSEELDVAVKRPRPEYAANEAFVSAFLAWAEEQKEIDHESVVGVLEAGKTSEGAYVIQECVDGVSLQEVLAALSKKKVATDPDKTGHVWDEDLDELNNPLPRWWIWLFWITIAFSLAYLWFYPGLGSWQGTLKWTSAQEYVDEVKTAQATHGPLYARLAAADMAALASDSEARIVGQRLFVNYCSQCHASDARGTKGFPNLADNDWLYGGDPATIKASILDGRNGVMPAWRGRLSELDAKTTAAWVYHQSHARDGQAGAR